MKVQKQVALAHTGIMVAAFGLPLHFWWAEGSAVGSHHRHFSERAVCVCARRLSQGLSELLCNPGSATCMVLMSY